MPRRRHGAWFSNIAARHHLHPIALGLTALTSFACPTMPVAVDDGGESTSDPAQPSTGSVTTASSTGTGTSTSSDSETEAPVASDGVDTDGPGTTSGTDTDGMGSSGSTDTRGSGSDTEGSSTSGASDTEGSSTSGSSGPSGSSTSGSSGTDGASTSGSSTSASSDTDGASTSGSSDTAGSSTTTDPGTTSFGTTGTDTDGDTDGDPPPTGCEADCVVGCEEILMSPLEGATQLWHTVDARLALDSTGKAVLWAAPADDEIASVEGVDAADLAADVLVLESLGIASVRSAFDASELGTVDVTGASWGLARDGSYLWAADSLSLRTFDPDGTMRWERVGDYSDAEVLPLATAVHVHASATGAAVEHIDAVTAMTTSTPIVGTFGGWFYDVERHWAIQGGAYRLYDTDGTELAFAVGTVSYGYGPWLVRNGGVASISDVSTTVIAAPGSLRDGAGILGAVSNTGSVSWLNLDQPALMLQMASLPTAWYTQQPVAFAFADDHFIVSNYEGRVDDEQGQPLAAGEIELLHGALSGRLGVATSIDATTVWDVSPSCVVTGQGVIARQSRPAKFTGDGTTLLASDYPPLTLNLYDVATGAVFDGHGYGGVLTYHLGMEVSDSGNLISVRSLSNPIPIATVYAYPGWVPFGGGGNWAVTPVVSPNGTLSANNDAEQGFSGTTYDGSLSYVHDAAGLVSVFDGVVLGFLDDATLLVAHYTFLGGTCTVPGGACDQLVAVEVTDTLGGFIAASPIPDPHELQRITASEVFLPDPPAIYDVYTGSLLWSGAPGPAAPVGLDHVAHVVDGDLVLTKWR